MYYYITSTFRVRDGTSFKRGNYWPGELCTKYPRTAHLIISYVHATSDGDTDHRLSRRMARHFDMQYLYAVSAPVEGNKNTYICILMYPTYYLHNHSCYVEVKCQLDATEVFIADLIACSTCFGHHYAHHQEFKSIIQWLLRVVFYALVFQVAGLVWSWGLCVRFEGCWFTLLHLVGILFPHINDDARSKSHQIYQNYVYQFLL